MKAISLWQPWASLWVSGVKIHETRHWHIKDQWKAWAPGERIAVHAAKRFEKDHDPYLADVLRRVFGPVWFKELPVGAVIGTISVSGCYPAGQIFGGTKFSAMHPAERDDFLSGNFEEGRWAWRGEAPIAFPVPILMRGAQGIFNVPDEVITNAKETPHDH